MKVMSDIIACLYKIAEAIKQKKQNSEDDNDSNNNDNQNNNNNKNTFLGFIEPDAISVYIPSESGCRIFKTIEDAKDYYSSSINNLGGESIWTDFNFIALYADNTLDAKYCVASGNYWAHDDNDVFHDDSVVFVNNLSEIYSFDIYDEPIINNDEDINYYYLNSSEPLG